MVDKTKKLGLQFLEAGDQLTESIERDRFTTIDVQLESIFRALGNGRISGAGSWEIKTDAEITAIINSGVTVSKDDITYFNPDANNSANNDRFVYLTPGYGHVNHMAAETVKYIKIGYLPHKINHIYFYSTPQTPRTKIPGIAIFPVKQDTNNVKYLHIAEVQINSSNEIVSVNQDSLLEVSALSVLLVDLIQHTHGRDGISKIDLETEVRGLLSSDNISDIDPSRINTGTLNPSIIELSHLLLKDSGTLTHSELDSAVELLQKSSKKLFGEITSTNLMQSVLAVKRVHANVDSYFRNFISIVFGLDNITNENPNSYLDHTTYVSSSNEDDDSTNKETALADPDQDKREDAAIVDFANFEARGIISGGNTMYEFSVDTQAEFEAGDYNDSFIKITSDPTAVYGYGIGYGEGNEYFDVFGVAAGEWAYGYPYHEGYGFEDWESIVEFFEYEYTYGYEITDGGDFSPGHVQVTLKPGSSDLSLYDTSDVITYGDLIDDTNIINDFFGGNSNYLIPPKHNPNDSDNYVKNKWLLTGYVETSGTSGVDIDIYDSVLRFNVDPNDTDFDGDLSSYNTLNITFGRDWDESGVLYQVEGGDEETSWTFLHTWKLRIEFANGQIVYLPISGMETGDSFDISSAVPTVATVALTGLPDSKATSLTIIPHIKGTQIKDYWSTNNITGSWDYNDGITIPSTDDQHGLENAYIGSDTYDVPLVWARGLSSIGLSGIVNYSSIDSNNDITGIYIVVPSSQSVTWETISWIADEPSDSRVAFQLRSVDSNTIVGDPYAELDDTDFGNTYSNKSGSVDGGSTEPARPTGSTISESAGTHLEIRVILQPSSDTPIAVAPTLHAINIKWSVDTGPAELVIEGSEGFNSNLQTTSDRINIRLSQTSPDESVEVKHYADIGKALLGTTNRFTKYDRVENRGFRLISSTNQININSDTGSIPKSPHQIINGLTSKAGSLYSVKRMLNHDIIVADTENNRILIFDDSKDFKFKKGIYGSTAMIRTKRFAGDTATGTTIDKFFTLLQAIFNPVEKTLYLVFSHALGQGDFKMEDGIVKITSSSDVLSTIILADSDKYDKQVGYDFSTILSDSGKDHIRIPTSFYLAYNEGNGVQPHGAAQEEIANVIRISLSDSEANAISNMQSPKQVNIKVQRENGDLLVPMSAGFTAPSDYVGEPLYGTDSNSESIDNVQNTQFVTLEEAEIYYRPIVHPVDIEVLHDDTIVVANLLGPVYTSKGVINAAASGAVAGPGDSFDSSSIRGEFLHSFNRTETSSPGFNVMTASIQTHPRFQFYDFDKSDILARNSDGTVKKSDGNIDGDNGLARFSLSLNGSIKEIIIDDVYYYMIADPGNRQVYITDTDMTEIIWRIRIEDIESELGDATYYPTCADKGDTYYYISLVGYNGSTYVDNKIIEVDQNYEIQNIILNKQVGNPLDIDYYNNPNSEESNSLIIST